MTIVVTGGAGFIGSNFIFYMLKKYPDYRITCIDKLTYAGNLATLNTVLNNPKFRFIKGDINSKSIVEEIFEEEQPQIVVNFAAESHVDRSIRNPKLFLKTNALGTMVLLEACRKYGIKRFHQISTDEVYGDIPLECVNNHFTEQSLIQTNSPYSSSKAAADLMSLAYYKTYGLPVTISRCANNYGPYQFPEKLIPLTITNAIENRIIPVYGDGLNVRNWLYVEDHCSAVDLILHYGTAGEIYNIGSSFELSNIYVIKHILHIMNKSENLISYVQDRCGHDKRYAINSNKISQELGWYPKMDFYDGIKYTVNWYLDNYDWWKPLQKNK